MDDAELPWDATRWAVEIPAIGVMITELGEPYHNELEKESNS